MDNDYLAVALTASVLKPLEKLLSDVIHMEVKLPLDLFQVACGKKRKKKPSDAISMLISKLLESLAAYARLLFIDFSSA